MERERGSFVQLHRLRAVETCTARNPNVWSHLLQLKHLIRKFRRLGAPGRVKSIPPALHLRPSFVPLLPLPFLPVSITKGDRVAPRPFSLLFFVTLLFDHRPPPHRCWLPANSILPRTLLPSPKETLKNFSNSFQPLLERLILKFREERFVDRRYSPIARAHIQNMFVRCFCSFAHPPSRRYTVFINFVQRLPVSINFCTVHTDHACLVHQFNYVLYNHSSRGYGESHKRSQRFTNR